MSYREAIKTIMVLLPESIQSILSKNRIWQIWLFGSNHSTLTSLALIELDEIVRLYSLSNELVEAIQKMKLLVNRSKYP